METPAHDAIVVVDDQEAFRAAVRRLVAYSDRFEIVAEATSAGEAIPLITALHPGLVLMDIGLPDGSGIGATRELVSTCPGLVVVLVSSYAGRDLPSEAWTCGARAYLHKEDLTAETIAGVVDGSVASATMFTTHRE